MVLKTPIGRGVEGPLVNVPVSDDKIIGYSTDTSSDVAYFFPEMITTYCQFYKKTNKEPCAEKGILHPFGTQGIMSVQSS